MKRAHTTVSCTPLLAGKKGRTASRPDSLCGTPVQGLTGSLADTPESDERPAGAIPETTQRRLEGFCLNTPLTLSQAAAAEQDAETPTLGVKEPAAQQQQQQQRAQRAPAVQQPCQPAAQQPCQLVGAGPPASQGRHRLANISNLPPTLASASAGLCPAGGDAASGGTTPMQTGGTTGRAQRSRRQQQQQQQVMFQPGLFSPPATLPGPASAVRRGAAAAAAVTPYSAARLPGLAAPPGSAGGDDDCGFVLHTSQSYSRASQPAISPSVAAGLSAAQPAEEEEAEAAEADGRAHRDGTPRTAPFTTPSQDSREPRHSPSNATSLVTTTVTAAFEQPPLACVGAARPPRAAACAGPSSQQQPQQQPPPQQQQRQQQLELVAPAGAAGATPGDGMLLGGRELEETTTPELEQIGLASQECGSQQQCSAQPQLPDAAGGAGAAVAAAAAAAAAGAGPAGGSRGAGRSGGGSSGSARSGGVVCEEVTARQTLFPIFRPKSQRKCVILVRHGESTYNKHDSHGKLWSDPLIFDAPLTARGRQQAVSVRDKLRDTLERHAHLGDTLWLSSPLTRALETMMLAAPQVGELATATAGAASSSGGGSSRAGSGAASRQRVMVLSLISEQCATTGDVGRPASDLATRFPALAPQLAELPEQWWYNPCPDNPNCAMQRLFNKVETVEQCRRRVSEFSRWLHARPEQLVVAFGHSTFWRYFANTKQRLRNCEVLQMWW